MNAKTKDGAVIFTVVDSVKPNQLMKKYELCNGQLKKSTSSNLFEGFAKLKFINSFEEFADVLQSLKTNQALCYGVLPKNEGRLTTRNQLASAVPDTFARTNDHFSRPDGAGVLMLDYDPKDDSVLRKGELYNILYETIPALKQAGSVWWSSTSSYIFNGEKQLNGLRGQRIYFLVINASDIPRAGKVLMDRLWLHGYGDIVASKSGQLLEKTTFDGSVW